MTSSICDVELVCYQHREVLTPEIIQGGVKILMAYRPSLEDPPSQVVRELFEFLTDQL